MALVGLATLSVYLAAATVLYLLVETMWAVRPPAGTLVAALLLATVVFASLSYTVGTARVLHGVHASELGPDRAPTLLRRLAAYSDAMGIDRPRLLVAELGQPNAFALGGGIGRGMVVVDHRLFDLLTFEECVAILAHELAHIERRDSLVQTFGFTAIQTLSGLVMLALSPVLLATAGLAKGLAWMRGRPLTWERTVPGRVRRAIVGAVTVGLFALTLLLFALSRRREFAADDRAAAVTGNPIALARALRKIEAATGGPWELLAQLYVNSDDGKRLQELFSTHPDTERRVERLHGQATAARQVRRIPVR
jgi:heat shock protein HtpX